MATHRHGSTFGLLVLNQTGVTYNFRAIRAFFWVAWYIEADEAPHQILHSVIVEII